MRRLITFIIDIALFLAIYASTLVLVLTIITKQQGDLLIITSTISQNLHFFLIITYISTLIAILLYFVFIPALLKTTPAMLITNSEYAPNSKANILSLFLKNLIGATWDVLLFPITIILLLLKKSIPSTRLSGIELQKDSITIFVRLINLLLVVGIIGITGFFLYRIGKNPQAYLSSLINYEKYIKTAITLKDYSALQSLLPKYEQKYGKDATYTTALCLSNAYLQVTEDNATETLNICNQAQEQASTNGNTYLTNILLAKIQIYKIVDSTEKAKTIYKNLLQQNYDGVEILEYFNLISRDNRADALKQFISWLKLHDNGLDLSLQNQHAVAELFFDLQSYENALKFYNLLLEKVSENNAKAGILFRIGECYYQLNNTAKAKEYFEQAQKLDKTYTNLVESYIIDMKLHK